MRKLNIYYKEEETDCSKARGVIKEFENVAEKIYFELIKIVQQKRIMYKVNLLTQIDNYIIRDEITKNILNNAEALL